MRGMVKAVNGAARMRQAESSRAECQNSRLQSPQRIKIVTLLTAASRNLRLASPAAGARVDLQVWAPAFYCVPDATLP